MLSRAWLGWVTRAIRSSRTDHRKVRHGLATSTEALEFVQARLSPPLDIAHEITQRELLAATGFDRLEYAKDLFKPVDAPAVNTGLVRWMEQANDDFHPDFVISFSQNRYLDHAFPESKKLYAEFAPYGRVGTIQALFLDPCGHQVRNMLVEHWDAIISDPLAPSQPEALRHLWQEAVEIPTREHPAFESTTQWLQERAKGRKIAMLAMQPPDWLTYEGALGPVPLSSLVMRWLDALPEGWAGCVTFHPHHRLPAAACKLIEREFPNAIILPEDAPRGASELLLPIVDAVVTISSSVGVQAALWGKPVSAQGRSSLSALGSHSIPALATASGLAEVQRLRLWRFLTNRYAHPLDSLINDGGYLPSFLDEWGANRYSEEFFLDGNAWDATRAERILLGGPKSIEPGSQAVPPEPPAKGKRLLLFNETNVLHHIGCQAVSDGHKRIAERAGASQFETVDMFEIRRFFSPLLRQIPFRDEPAWFDEAANFLASRPALREIMAPADGIVVNGEGTIHHGAGMPYLALLLAAKRIGKGAALVNALLEALPTAAGHPLSQLDVFTVRDPRSQREAERIGASAIVEPDAIVEARFGETVERDFQGRAVISDAHWEGGIDIVETLRISPPVPMDYWRMDDFIDWRTAVASLRTASVYITARHHGVYLAMLAGIPFVPLPANTHKIHGTLEMLAYPEEVCTHPRHVAAQIQRALADPERLTSTYERVLGRAPLTSFSGLLKGDGLPRSA